MNHAPYSYGKIKKWLTCPAQYHAQYVAKTVRSSSSPALERGKQVHSTLEQSLVQGTEPTSVWTPAGLIPKLYAAGATPETQYAIDQAGNPCGYWDKTCWLRGAIDVQGPIVGPTIRLIDYKTGGFRPDSLQSDVYATLIRRCLKRDLTVDFTFLYIDKKRTHTEQPDGGAEDRVRAVTERIENDVTFDPTPCWACRFCPLYTCPYNDNH